MVSCFPAKDRSGLGGLDARGGDTRLVVGSADQEPAKAWTARTGQASASGSALTTRSANTEAGSLSHAEQMIGERTWPPPNTRAPER